MIYLVEDDVSIRDLMIYALGASGLPAKGFSSSPELWEALSCEMPKLIILDIMLPGEDGISILKKLRANPATSAVPVIMATARATEYDKVTGLDLGADDYLIKPFSFDELSARLRVMTRKKYGGKTGIISVGDLTVDTASRRVERAGREISLSAKEYELLCYLVMNNGVVLSREKIEDHIWNYDYEGGTNVVDVYIRYLRKKIDEGEDTKLIHTVRGAGYVIR